METTKRGSKKIKTHYGMPDYYKYYINKYDVEVSRKIYNDIVGDFNKKIIDIILNKSEEYRLPVLGLTLSIKKEKRVPRIKDGKLYLTAPVDWVTTKKLWISDSEAKDKKILVRYSNYHTSGYVFRVFMQKFGVRLKNRSVYKFRTSRYFQRSLGRRINDTKKDKFDCYLLYKTKQ